MSSPGTELPRCLMPPCPQHRARWRTTRHDRPRISGWHSRPASLQHRLYFIREVRKASGNWDWIFLEVSLVVLPDRRRDRWTVRDESPKEPELGLLPVGVFAQQIVIGVLFLYVLLSADQDVRLVTPA